MTNSEKEKSDAVEHETVSADWDGARNILARYLHREKSAGSVSEQM